ncbi:GAF and ANTAR domain-containing protein [Hamadaea tsunoensis]|uniref:GAF and ANTAR domain-containing protein n=1 Tax=Hamadaea tsunoensis TaxID=53368 RepID=UPI0004155FE1|nr:GAF and ANTAR domain-containing protein [Hamadaea tsunoensis]
MDDYVTRVYALIAAEPVADRGPAGLSATMRRLCTAVGRAVDAHGVGMTVMAPDGVRGMSAASDPATERLEDLQLTLGEGPCIDAFERRVPVLVPNLADEMARWPVYAPEVHAGGIRAVFAFPLQTGGARLGVLDVFRGEPGSLSNEALALCLTFADAAVASLLDGEEHRHPTAADDGLGDSLGVNTVLFQAQGMVMVQLKVPLAEAMARIRARAYAENRPLTEIAADVVARRLSFDQDRQ